MTKKNTAEPSSGVAGGSARFDVSVHPRSSSEILALLGDGSLDIRLKAPPVEGKANEGLIKFLSRCLKVKKSSVAIISGEKSRRKIVSISGLTKEEVIERIKSHR
jgi:uncharacterized protein